MLSSHQKSEVKKFLEKYEKYFNFQDSQDFDVKLKTISSDACKKANMGKEKSVEVEDYIKDLYDLSDGEGLSFVLSPGPGLQYTQPDQVQRLQY